MNATPWKVMLISALAVVGCGGTDSSDAEDAVDTAQGTSSESALMDATSADATTAASSADSNALAMNASMKLKNAVTPASCLTETVTLNTVVYVFDHCKGPRGLATITGTVTVVYTRNADGSMQAAGTGMGIEVNSATVDLNATAVYSKDTSSGLEKLVVNSQSDITGLRGITGNHLGSYTVTRDDADCTTLDGTWSTDWTGAKGGTAKTSTTATGLKKCGTSCPAAGGSIEHDGLLGRTVSITLDGSDTAKWSSSDGKSGTVNLSCGS